MASTDQKDDASTSAAGVTAVTTGPTVASQIPFGEICGFLEKVQKKKGSDAKKNLFKDFLGKWRAFHKQLHAKNPKTTDNFYPAMRLLLPQLERERMAYGIKEHTLAKLYIDILGLAKESTDARKLLNYRAPTAKQEAGDFASVAFFVLRNRCPERGSLTIKDVNDNLDSIALNNATKKKDLVKQSLLTLLRKTSAIEQKWLIRMIMKEMKVGLSQQSILGTFHPDAEDFFNVTNSLAKVCSDLSDPSVRLNEIAISVFSPFSPMLGERAKITQVERIMEHKSFLIETKLDGERMQLHKEGDKYMYFSRRSHDYSGSFGKSPMEGSLTPYIANCFKSNVHSCILDGEMCAYNADTKAFISKGENFDIKSLRDDEDVQVCYAVFDVLLVNDTKLANRPLKERLSYLPKVFTVVEGRMVLVERRDAATKAEVVEALNDAIDRREEGIVVKHPESTYRPDKRKGSGWLKIKPEYVDNLMDELDLLVVGGYFGKGFRAQLISHFLCAVAVPPSREGDHPKIFYSFCKVGSGYTLQELYEFNQKLAKHWKKYDKENPPRWLQCTREKPELYVEPQNSFIVQIKATEINSSNVYKTGCTLRFPRLEKVRDDKDWHQCMTTEELENMRQQAEGKLTGRYANVDDDEIVTSKRRKVTARVERPVAVPSRFRAADTSNVKQTSEMLDGRELCIMNSPASHPKHELEKKVVECGGVVVQNPGIDTYCVLADKVNLKVKNIFSAKIYDVVKTTWLIECLDAGHLLPWLPSHMLYTSAKMAAQFALDYDSHGDSYTEDVSEEKLKEIFATVGKKSEKPMSAEEIAEIEMDYFPQDSHLGLFRLCRVYMDSCLVIGEEDTHIKDCSLDLISLEMRFHGATMCPTLDRHVTHIIVDKSDLSRVREFRQRGQQRALKQHVVTSDWVTECIQKEKLISERPYEAAMS
ncbi:DNA ligase 4-like isoform X2 [Lytechinus variegatus]|uniref:DNA ligase 4-like isoform X2 n=1 Tax=Lytechinus variegatus TaxID=7654 RepID=UPI001BB11099|nr:DNA ligase 4-like isoform X2 [Lytechinus variegatus]